MSSKVCAMPSLCKYAARLGRQSVNSVTGCEVNFPVFVPLQGKNINPDKMFVRCHIIMKLALFHPQRHSIVALPQDGLEE